MSISDLRRKGALESYAEACLAYDEAQRAVERARDQIGARLIELNRVCAGTLPVVVFVSNETQHTDAEPTGQHVLILDKARDIGLVEAVSGDSKQVRDWQQVNVA